jgi:hypothetical protein
MGGRAKKSTSIYFYFPTSKTDGTCPMLEGRLFQGATGRSVFVEITTHTKSSHYHCLSNITTLCETHPGGLLLTNSTKRLTKERTDCCYHPPQF